MVTGASEGSASTTPISSAGVDIELALPNLYVAVTES
jgi:hypothetical protein